MKLGTTELLVILAIIIVLFGPSQLPKLAKMFGKSVKNVRKGMEENDKEQIAADQTGANADQTQTAADQAHTDNAQ